MFKPALKMLGVEPVGNYAIRINWSDGHNSGIYSYEHFRRICPCDECKAAQAPCSDKAANEKGRSVFGPPFITSSIFRYSRRKLTSICASTVTGLPSLVPGLKRHFFTASIAFSSRPSPRLCSTRMLTALPSGLTCT